MFHKQLLRIQIPKRKKKTDSLTIFFALSVSELVKAACKMLIKLTLGHRFQRLDYKSVLDVMLLTFQPFDPKIDFVLIFCNDEKV